MSLSSMIHDCMHFGNMELGELITDLRMEEEVSGSCLET